LFNQTVPGEVTYKKATLAVAAVVAAAAAGGDVVAAMYISLQLDSRTTSRA
jgi:hypothetical protein